MTKETFDQVQEALEGLQPGITVIGAMIFTAGLFIEVRQWGHRPASARLPRKVHRELVETLGHEPPAVTHDGRPGRALIQLGIVVAAMHPLVSAFSYLMDYLT